MLRILCSTSIAFALWTCATSAAELAIVGALVYPSPEAAPIHDATVIDARGTTVVAGFWNSHVHLIGNELRDAERRPAPAAQAALERMLTRWGFTTAFELAGVPGNALALSRRIARGELRGPLLLSVDAPFYPRGGTPVYVRELYARHGWPSAEVADAEQARDRARRQLAAGAHGVKLFTGAIVGPPIGVLPMSVDIASAIVHEAHSRGCVAFAHASDLRGIEVAIAAGVDVLAHTTPESGAWPDDLAGRLKANDIALIPTLLLFESELAKAGAPAEVRQRIARDAAQQLKRHADAGGTIRFGTDVGFIDDTDTTREIRLMADAGLDWRAILASLTTAPAARYGFAQRKGRVAQGMDADLVLLGSDPARDPAALANVRATIREGVVLYRAP